MNPNISRFVVTSFDNSFFNAGINLIAGIHRTSFDIVKKIIVFDLGLEKEKKNELEKLEKVQVVPYPDIVYTFYDGYMDIENYGFKASSVKFAGEYANPGDLILWMDGGLVPLKSLDEIFRIIKKEDIFFVDHNDRPGWPFYNIHNTHPRCLELLNATKREKFAPHMRAALLGYKYGGKYQQKIIDTVFRHSQNKEILVWPKHLTDEERKAFPLAGAKRNRFTKFLRKTLQRFPFLNRLIPEYIYRSFSYWGHRHDQSIFSILRARYRCKYYPGTKYCLGSNASTQVSKLNWQGKDGARIVNQNDLELDNIDEDVIIFQHRGLYNNLDGLKYKGSPKSDNRR